VQAQRQPERLWKFANFPSHLTALPLHRDMIFCLQEVPEKFLALTCADCQQNVKRAFGSYPLAKIC
jgi:hypothetical protein